MRVRTLASAPLLSVFLAVATPAVASAAPSDLGAAPTIPSMHIELIFAAGYHKVCASGTAAASGTWAFSMTGARSDGTTFTPSPTSGSGTTFGHCETMSKLGANSTLAAYGNHTEQLTYSGSTGSVTFSVFGNGTWDSNNIDYGATTG